MTRTPNYYGRPDPFTGTTVIEIDVPSGQLIASDDLRSVPHFDIDTAQSINYGAGLDAWTRDFADRAQVAQAFVGNTCPRVTRRQDGTLVVVSPEYDEETDQPRLLDGEVTVASICTDLWSTMLTDYEHWRAQGGPEVAVANAPYALDKFSLIDVEPGLYRWTVFSNDDSFDIDRAGRVEYARLERVDAL